LRKHFGFNRFVRAKSQVETAPTVFSKIVDVRRRKHRDQGTVERTMRHAEDTLRSIPDVFDSLEVGPRKTD